MLLAQILMDVIESPETKWTVIGGVFVAVLGAIGVLLNNHQKGLREQSNADRDNQLSVEIRDCLRNIEKVSTEQNGKLDLVVKTDENHHAELIRVLQTNCKAMPTVVQQINKPE
jgi:hypothetical protein